MHDDCLHPTSQSFLICWPFIRHGDANVSCILLRCLFLRRDLFSPPWFHIPQVKNARLNDVLHLATEARVRYRLWLVDRLKAVSCPQGQSCLWKDFSGTLFVSLLHLYAEEEDKAQLPCCYQSVHVDSSNLILQGVTRDGRICYSEQ